MKHLDAKRAKIRIGDFLEFPLLHILLSEEDGLIVARCLDFRVSSHGRHEEQAIAALAEAIKEYVLTAIENGSTYSLYDPARQKYWQAYRDIEKQKSISLLNNITSSFGQDRVQAIHKATPELIYA